MSIEEPAMCRSSFSRFLLIGLATAAFFYALYVAIKYVTQIPLDLSSFRQTQTALTAYWLRQNGLNLAYETPVAGPPWSIPFEFPVYQYIVALIWKLTNFPLNAIGRIVSFLFLVLCLAPSRSITKSLKLPDSVFYVFAALLLSSPLYLYYGRTFMMETAAVFFCVATIKYFVDFMQSNLSLKCAIAFLLFATLGILEKVTTALPVLFVLGIVYCALEYNKEDSIIGNVFSKKAAIAIVGFGIPLAVGAIWTLYTDRVKTLNGLGVSLTSSALSQWNWGTLDQRLSMDLFGTVIWNRLFEKNLCGTLGAAILLVALLSRPMTRWKWIIIASFSMGILPLFLFTNLHIIHEYYQISNLIFLIYALAVAMVLCSVHMARSGFPLLVLLAIELSSNYYWFAHDYLEATKAVFNKANSRNYAVADILKRELPKDRYFAAFGNDWDSSLAYLSERKSFTVPKFFSHYAEISLHPERFFPANTLGGVVLCEPIDAPTLGELMSWASNGRRWKVGESQGCYIAVPETPTLTRDASPSQVDCQGSIDVAKMDSDKAPGILSVSGWIAAPGEKKGFPEKVYVTLNRNGEAPLYFEALQVNRPDIDAFFHRPDSVDFGFSREIDARALGNVCINPAAMCSAEAEVQRQSEP